MERSSARLVLKWVLKRCLKLFKAGYTIIET
jgi:hypothetical protein